MSDDSDIANRGRCTDGSSHELFFSDRPSDLSAAQALCRVCEVRRECLERAQALGCDWGVWGGVIFLDGRAYHRKRGRGRPRRGENHEPLEASAAELEELVRSA